MWDKLKRISHRQHQKLLKSLYLWLSFDSFDPDDHDEVGLLFWSSEAPTLEISEIACEFNRPRDNLWVVLQMEHVRTTATQHVDAVKLDFFRNETKTGNVADGGKKDIFLIESILSDF